MDLLSYQRICVQTWGEHIVTVVVWGSGNRSAIPSFPHGQAVAQ